MNRTIVLNDAEPAPLSIRHPLGINLDLTVTFLTQAQAPANPALMQFVLLPRSRGGVMPFDMEVEDPVRGIASVFVPGLMLTDRSGYGIELYTRRENTEPSSPPLPTGMAAKGALLTHGSAYVSEGPLNLINVPVVYGPPGPPGEPGLAGEQGEQGTRGSMWTTGVGDPVPHGIEVAGDMYLNESNGDVWRWDGTSLMWVRGQF